MVLRGKPRKTTIRNVASLSSVARKNVEAAGYKIDPSGKTATRSPVKKTTVSKPKEKALETQSTNIQPVAISEGADTGAQQLPTITGVRPETEPQTPAKRGGLQNVADVLKIALNPFSRDKITANVENPTLKKILELGANNPYTTAGLISGVGGLLKGAISSITGATTKTAVTQAGRVGTAGLFKQVGSSTAGTFATNAATKTVTAGWLTRIAAATKSPQFVAGTLMAAIGSYPFAGFIKEEALQTLGFSVRTALDNDDFEGAEQALDQTKEILDPGMWSEIKSNIPFVNVLDNLDDFYTAARTKMVVDERVIADKKIQFETGETDTERWARVKTEQATQDQAMIDYYNTERQKLLEWESEAREKQRDEDAAFWAEQRQQQRKLEEEDRKAIADFWEQYKKRMQLISDNNRPSKLNFGLL